MNALSNEIQMPSELSNQLEKTTQGATVWFKQLLSQTIDWIGDTVKSGVDFLTHRLKITLQLESSVENMIEDKSIKSLLSGASYSDRGEESDNESLVDSTFSEKESDEHVSMKELDFVKPEEKNPRVIPVENKTLSFDINSSKLISQINAGSDSEQSGSFVQNLGPTNRLERSDNELSTLSSEAA